MSPAGTPVFETPGKEIGVDADVLMVFDVLVVVGAGVVARVVVSGAAASTRTRPPTIAAISQVRRIVALPAVLLDELREGADGLKNLAGEVAVADLESESLL
jgi:hypothetical protein